MVLVKGENSTCDILAAKEYSSEIKILEMALPRSTQGWVQSPFLTFSIKEAIKWMRKRI